jgi:hypothetical protein
MPPALFVGGLAFRSSGSRVRLQPGQASAYPLANKGLRYIMEVEGRRQGPAPPLHDVIPQLKQEISFAIAGNASLPNRSFHAGAGTWCLLQYGGGETYPGG